MAYPDNGLVGGIKSVFWRRCTIVLLALPIMLVGILPVFVRGTPAALADAWDAFADHFRPATNVLVTATRECWSKSWKPA